MAFSLLLGDGEKAVSHRLRRKDRMMNAYLIGLLSAACALNAVMVRADDRACVRFDKALACDTEEHLDELGRLGRNDEEAFTKALYLRVAAGQCTVIAPNTDVFIEGRTILSQRRKVREKGSLTSYWLPAQWTTDGACSTPAAPPSLPPGEKPRADDPRYKDRNAPTDKPGCVWKDTMTAEEISACR